MPLHSRVKAAGVKPLFPAIIEGAEDAVALAAGTNYLAGQVLGQVPGTGTAVNEVQTITPTAVTAGSFRLLYRDQYTGLLAWNATQAQIDAALEAITEIGPGNITIGGAATANAGAWTVTFTGDTGGLAHPMLVVVPVGLTGTFAVTRTTPGKPVGGYFDVYNDALSNGLQVAKRILHYDVVTNARGEPTFGDAINLEFPPAAGMGAPAWYRGIFRCSDLVGLDAAAVVDLGKFHNGSAISDYASSILVYM
jgi:hypothetical protein